MALPHRQGSAGLQVVVAGFGNVLRRDDGFGVEVVDALSRGPVPSGVALLDIGIGGIHLVQQLGEDVDALIVVDAVEVGRPPGTVVVVDPEVEDVSTMTVMERREHLADMHYATPERALMLARALGVLPRRTVVIGCQPQDVDTFDRGLTPAVATAVATAAAEVRRTVTALGLPWEPDGTGGA